MVGGEGGRGRRRRKEMVQQGEEEGEGGRIGGKETDMKHTHHVYARTVIRIPDSPYYT